MCRKDLFTTIGSVIFATTVQRYNGRLADEELLRFYWPFMVFGVQNIFRVYQPILTEPLFPHGRAAGLGDTTLFDQALYKLGKFTLGAGPLSHHPRREPQ